MSAAGHARRDCYNKSVRPDRLLHPQSLIPLVKRLTSEPIDLELFVMKCHLVVERELYSLLSVRLEIEEKHLPQLQFHPLAKLALGGDVFNKTLLETLALNDLRNQYGHDLDTAELDTKAAILVDRSGTFWPSHKALQPGDSLEAARDTSVRVASMFVIGDVWIHITELCQEKRFYSSEESMAAARTELEFVKASQRDKRAKQQSLRVTFGAPST